MDTFRRLLIPVLLMLTCLLLITGAAYAYFVREAVAAPGAGMRMGAVDFYLDENSSTDLKFDVPAQGGEATSDGIVFGNNSTVPVRVTAHLVPIWQDASANPLPLPVDMLTFTLKKKLDSGVFESIPCEGDVCRFALEPGQKELTLTVTVQVAGSLTSEYNGKSLSVQVFFEAVPASLI